MRSPDRAPSGNSNESLPNMLSRVLDALKDKLKGREGEKPQISGLFDDLVKTSLGDDAKKD